MTTLGDNIYRKSAIRRSRMAYLAAAFVCVGVFGYADDKPWSTEDEQTVLEKAEAGDAYCQATVARWLRRGDNGNAICTEEAYKWATRSAEQGNPLGMYEQQVGLRLGTNANIVVLFSGRCSASSIS